MSASVLCPWAFHVPEEAVKRAFNLGNSLGKKTSKKEELLKFLYETSADDIMKTTENLSTVK